MHQNLHRKKKMSTIYTSEKQNGEAPRILAHAAWSWSTPRGAGRMVSRPPFHPPSIQSENAHPAPASCARIPASASHAGGAGGAALNSTPRERPFAILALPPLIRRPNRFLSAFVTTSVPPDLTIPPQTQIKPWKHSKTIVAGQADWADHTPIAERPPTGSKLQIDFETGGSCATGHHHRAWFRWKQRRKASGQLIALLTRIQAKTPRLHPQFEISCYRADGVPTICGRT